MRFARRKLRLQGFRNFLRHFTLHRKDIFEIPIVSLRPEVGIGASVNKLDVDSHFIASSLNCSLEDGRNAEFFRDRLQVVRLALIFCGGRARNHLEITDHSQLGENLILNTLGEVGIGFFLAQVFERENRDRFVCDLCLARLLISQRRPADKK